MIKVEQLVEIKGDFATDLAQFDSKKNFYNLLPLFTKTLQLCCSKKGGLSRLVRDSTSKVVDSLITHLIRQIIESVKSKGTES